MKNLHILVVEDEPSNREIAEVILTSHGHRVTCAENGEEALRLCLEEDLSFDAILMDVLMPVMDGLEATRQLRANPKTRDLTIVCVSAKASGSDQGAGLAAGCDTYVRKPYKRKELLQALSETLLAKGVIDAPLL
jgi:Response regulators consisting of a CheY-like receiver domain and a winged-helix DNA-binding domain